MCKLNDVLRATILIAVCLTNAVLSQDWVNPSSSTTCTTPDRKTGQCINLTKCQPLLQMLQNAPKPISQDIVLFLRRSQCGFEGSKPKVCCSSRSIPAEQSTNDNNEAPDVSAHPNLSLLPHTICGASLEDRIVRGNKTGLFEFPWMALLAYRSKTGDISFRCGGSLITDRYVLTAAHCLLVEAQGLKLEGVRLGEHNINTVEDCEIQEDGSRLCADPVQDRTVEQVIIHPGYSKKNYNDIALIRLASPADLGTDSVRPVCLPISNSLQNMNLTGRSAVVTGWGYTEHGTRSPDLLKVGLPVVDNDQCATVYSRRTTIISKQLCAGGTGGRDSCGGDSGGPLKLPGNYNGQTRVVQYGVVSFGPVNCGAERIPGVYTRVTHYMDWILDNLRP